jgi:hypothetical protein
VIAAGSFRGRVSLRRPLDSGIAPPSLIASMLRADFTLSASAVRYQHELQFRRAP